MLERFFHEMRQPEVRSQAFNAVAFRVGRTLIIMRPLKRCVPHHSSRLLLTQLTLQPCA